MDNILAKPPTLLTRAILRYQRMLKDGKASPVDLDLLLSDILKQCYTIIYRYPTLIKQLEEEDAAEFLLNLATRIPGIVREFRYEWISFESYLKKIIFWQVEAFIKRRRYQERRYVCDPNEPEEIERLIAGSQDGTSPYRTVAWESLASEDQSLPYDSSNWDMDHPLCQKIKERMVKSAKLRNRMLQLVLLCSDALNARQIALLAEFLSMNEQELADLITQSLNQCDRRIEINEELRSTRDLHFFGKLHQEREYAMLQSIQADPYYIKQSKQRLERETQFFMNRQQEAWHRTGVVTHAVVGKLLGIPKGTVDSGMQALRKIVGELMDDIP